MRTLIALLAILLTSCAALDRMGTDTSRTDAVYVDVVIESLPYAQLREKCAQWPNAVACTVKPAIYVQGEPKRTPVKFTVQFLNWADIGDKCGRFTGNGLCFEDNTLYTSSGYTSPYRLGAIGDEIDKAFNLGLDFNRRANLGHEMNVHILKVGQDPTHTNGTPHLMATQF